jgi:hypothetical protein
MTHCPLDANNCDNAEHQKIPSWGTDFINHYNGDVQATVDFGLLPTQIVPMYRSQY